MRSALKRARQAPAADAFAAPRGEKGAHVARLEREQLLHVRQAIEVAGEEGEELGDVSGVGFRGVGRELALDGEISEPILDRLADVRRPHITQALWPFLPSLRSPIWAVNGARARGYYGRVSR